MGGKPGHLWTKLCTLKKSSSCSLIMSASFSSKDIPKETYLDLCLSCVAGFLSFNRLRYWHKHTVIYFFFPFLHNCKMHQSNWEEGLELVCIVPSGRHQTKKKKTVHILKLHQPSEVCTSSFGKQPSQKPYSCVNTHFRVATFNHHHPHTLFPALSCMFQCVAAVSL